MFRLTAKTLRTTTIAIPILLATAIAIPSLLAPSMVATANAQQISVGIGFDNFHSQLAPYGTWSNHARWGEVWHPRAERDFRPYYNGRWEDTREYGWLWVSDDRWGDVPYHYGRWVFDPGEGWLWVPGYVWAPSWVVWREGGGNIGWFPMPPGDNYYGDGAYRDNFNTQYGYRDWYGPSFGNEQFLSLWIFVGQDHFRDRNYRNYAIPQRDYGTFISQTTNTTNYVTINNYVVNRSVDRDRLQRVTRQRFEPVAASSVIGRTAVVTQAREGRQIEQRERQRRPIPASIDRSDQRRDNPNTNAQQQKANPAQQKDRDRANVNPAERRQQTEPTEQKAKQPDTSRQKDRDQANVNPAERRQQQTEPAEQKAKQPDTSRQKDRDQANVNPAERRQQTEPAEQKAKQPDTNKATQGSPDRGRDEPNANDRTRSNAQPDREPRANNAPPNGNGDRQGQSQTRGAPDQKSNVIVQDARPSPRVQENAPDADKARANPSRASKEGDAKNADDREKADDKKARDDRGRN